MDYEVKFWIVFAVTLAAIIGSNMYMKSTGSKKSTRSFVTGILAIITMFVVVLVLGDPFELYWDMFDAEYLSEFIDMSLESFLGGIYITVCLFYGLVQVVRGFINKGKD